jgi:hypothetical protein
MTPSETSLAETREGPRPRRKWLWFVAGAVLLIVSLAMAAASLNRGPYAFLERFHPQHLNVDQHLDMQNMPSWSVAKPSLKFKMYVFKPEEASAVLGAMRRELNAAHGYTAIDAIPPQWKVLLNDPSAAELELEKAQGKTPTLTPMREEDWIFSRRRSPDSVEFISGDLATNEKDAYLGESSTVSSPPSPSCIVVFSYKESWLNRQLSAIRSWLHIG